MVVPSQAQALRSGEEKPFSKSQFRYDREKNFYVCPEGKELHYQGTNHRNGKQDYRITSPKICRGCPHFGPCTMAKRGRKIVRLALEGASKDPEKSSQLLSYRAKTNRS